MPGVIVGASSATNAAFTTGSFPDGSSVTIINQGRIQGAGGQGGTQTTSYSGYSVPGQPGGTALEIKLASTLDNSLGEIWGGGGGGASTHALWGAAGGGGGGAGTNPGGGGGNMLYGIPGQSGTATAGGIGGTIGTNPIQGGSGGAPGQAGNPSNFTASGYPIVPGGAAGAAIMTSGHKIVWLGGNDAARVKGPIQ